MCPHTTEPYIFTTEPFLFLAVSCRQREATQAYNTYHQKKKCRRLRGCTCARCSSIAGTLRPSATTPTSLQPCRHLSLAPSLSPPPLLRARSLSLQLRLPLWDDGGSIDIGSCASLARLVASSSLSLSPHLAQTNTHTLSFCHTHTHFFSNL